MIFPKISIITPSFNQGQFLERTILSIINQNYPNLEYIIIDGGSSDNSIEIIKKYEKYLKYWCNEKDNGQSDAINKGLQHCTGDIFNWINSDDLLEEDALAKIGKYFQENDIDILCAYSRIFDDKTNETIFKFRTTLFESTENTIVQQKINQPAMFYKTDIVKQLGGINETLNYVMDLELWFKYMCAYGIDRIKLVDDLFGHFRIHDISKTNLHEVQFRAEEKSVIYHMLNQYNETKPFLEFFSKTNTYIPQKWNFNNINSTQLLNAYSERYLFDFYKAKNYKAARKAYINLLFRGKLEFKKLYLGLFLKIFIADIKFSR